MDKLELTGVPVMRTGMLIRKPPADVFEPFVDPGITTKFWFTKGSGRLKVGRPVQWTWETYDVSATVTAKVIAPNERIVIEWPGYGGQTTVEWTFTPLESATFVEIAESGFTGDEGRRGPLASRSEDCRVVRGLRPIVSVLIIT